MYTQRPVTKCLVLQQRSCVRSVWSCGTDVGAGR